MKRDAKGQSCDVDGVFSSRGVKNRRRSERDSNRLQENNKIKSCLLCRKIRDKRELNGIYYNRIRDTYEHNEEIRLNQSQCHDLVRRFSESSQAKSRLCARCTSVMNDLAEKSVPHFLVYGLLLLIRRDCGRDFDASYGGRHLQLRVTIVQDLEVPVLSTEQQTYYSTNIIFRHGCKAHSVWDRRARLLHNHICGAPIGTNVATMLALAKTYFGAGFKLEREAEQRLISSRPSAANLKNASDVIKGDCSAKDVHTYFSYARDEEGSKNYLGPFAMMALMRVQAIPAPLAERLHQAADEFWTTSWGPSAAINYILGKKKLRYYSPKDAARTSSTRAQDKRLATGAVIVLSRSPFGKLIHDIFRAMNVPWGFACTINFLLCEARKYYAKPVAKYRQRFQDQAVRQRFWVDLVKQLGAVGLIHQGTDIGSFLTVPGSDEFITTGDWAEDFEDDEEQATLGSATLSGPSGTDVASDDEDTDVASDTDVGGYGETHVRPHPFDQKKGSKR